MNKKQISVYVSKLIPWFVPFILFISFFFVAYKLNTKENITRSKSISIFDAQREIFEEKIANIKFDSDSKTFNSNLINKQNIPVFEISYPATWSAAASRSNEYGKADYILGSAKECIQIYESIDNMPILEAKNYNLFMLEIKDAPYVTKDDIETKINGIPARVGKLILNRDQPEAYINYSIYVKDNKYSYVFHACPGTSEETFYKIHKSFRLIN